MTAARVPLKKADGKYDWDAIIAQKFGAPISQTEQLAAEIWDDCERYAQQRNWLMSEQDDRPEVRELSQRIQGRIAKYVALSTPVAS